MRTDGEISKEDFVEQKEKIESALSELNSEYERLTAEADQPIVANTRWDEISVTLNEIIDFSLPQISRDTIKKFVAKIIPNGKTHFRWYMNLDGNESTAMDVVIEGRKNNAVIRFADEEDKPPLHNGAVLNFSELMSFRCKETEATNSSLISMQHRQLSRTKGELLQVCSVHSHARGCTGICLFHIPDKACKRLARY